MTPPPAVKAEVGFRRFGDLQIGVTGSGTELTGHLSGDLKTFDWTLLYELHGVPMDADPAEWVEEFEQDRKDRILRMILPLIEEKTFPVRFTYHIKGNDKGIKSLIFGFQVIRLTVGKVSRNFTVVNQLSAGTRDENGHPYPEATISSASAEASAGARPV